MTSIDIDLLESILRYIVLPVVVGCFTIAVILIYDWRTAQRAAKNEERRKQLQEAQEVMRKVMQDAERLSSLMRYHAWAVAWRRTRPAGTFSNDLMLEDQKQWNVYDEALAQWRRNRIQYKVEIDNSFGRRETASKLFKLMDASMDKLSFELWFIYHDNPSNPNVFLMNFVEDIGQPYDTVFNAIMTATDKTISREQEENVHSVAAAAFDELQDKVHRLYLEMTKCIRNENVGTMRTINPSAMKSKASPRRISNQVADSSAGSG